jgi:DNA-binding response OmpR family regulator
MKVLIIDPDWTFSRQAAGYLESMAHLVVHQADRGEATELAQRWRPDLLIVAAEYVEDGILGALREAAPEAAVLLTEFMERYDRAWRAWQIGGDELLMKPVFHAKDLHSAIVAARESATTGVRPQPMSESA